MSSAPICYSFDPVIGLFLGAIPADPSPLEEDVWLDPAYTTRDAPPSPGSKQAVVRQGDTWALIPDHRGETWYRDDVPVTVSTLGDPVEAGLSPDTPAAPPLAAPDAPSLGDWRVGLLLWKRLDDVLARIQKATDDGDPRGAIAKERVEYSNHVLRAQLLSLKDAMGFTESDVDESLYRAHQVALGDLSGTWPLA